MFNEIYCFDDKVNRDPNLKLVSPPDSKSKEGSKEEGVKENVVKEEGAPEEGVKQETPDSDEVISK